MRQTAALALGGLLAAIVVLAVLLLVQPAAAREIKAACRGMQPTHHNPAYRTIPTQAHDFKAQNRQGESVSLSQFRGKYVLVNFWGSWCKVCKSEKPSLANVAKELNPDEFQVVTLASDTDWALVNKAMPKERFPHFTVLLDPPTGDDTLGGIAKSYGIKAVPESFLIDPNGQLLYYFVNKREWDSDVARTCLSGLIDG